MSHLSKMYGWTMNFCSNCLAVFTLWSYLAIIVYKGLAAQSGGAKCSLTQTKDQDDLFSFKTMATSAISQRRSTESE